MNKNSLFILLVALGLLSSCVHHDTFNPKTQLTADLKAIGDFLAGYDTKAQYVDDGIWYTIDTVGLGMYPVVSDSIKIEYSIRNIQTPDTELLGSKPDSLPLKLLSNLIAGLQYGLPRFPVGSYGRLYIPSGLAFGTAGNPPVNPNTNLLIKVKLVSAKGNRFSTDTEAVTKYLGAITGSLLADKKVLLKDTASGIYYWYDTLISGALHPDLGSHSVIDITYNAKLLNADTTHFAIEKSLTTINLTNQSDSRVITAWKIILPKIAQGSTVTMYIPSGYGFGSVLMPKSDLMPKGIPANSNLIYEVKLDSVH